MAVERKLGPKGPALGPKLWSVKESTVLYLSNYLTGAKFKSGDYLIYTWIVIEKYQFYIVFV